MLVNSVPFLGPESPKKKKNPKKLTRDHYITIFTEEVHVVQHKDMTLKVSFSIVGALDVSDPDVFVLMNIEFSLGHQMS